MTTPVPDSNTGTLDLSMGNDGYLKTQAELGLRLNDQMGVLVDALDYRSDGFKELSNVALYAMTSTLSLSGDLHRDYRVY